MAYSFSGFFNRSQEVGGHEGHSTSTGTAPKPATEGQVRFYRDLCAQKNMEPKEVEGWTQAELDAEIKKVKSYFPPSQGQIDLIRAKVENLNNLGVEMKVSEETMNSLTGGREGTASKLIEQLIEMEKQHQENLPPTEAQMKFLVDFFFCPDVAFEEFDIQRTMMLDEYDEISGKQRWRYLGPEEFAQECANKMNRREASRFIDKHRGAFQAWKSTRTRPGQYDHIRELEGRLSNTEVPHEVEWAVAQNGELQMVSRPVRDKGTKYAPQGYCPLSDEELIMMSSEEASKYINILKSEIERKELYQVDKEPEEERKTEVAEDEKELRHLEELMYQLEAVAGWTSDELHEAVSSLLVDGYDTESVRESRRNIREFMLALVHEGEMSFESLLDMCGDNKIAQKVMLGVA